MNILITWYIIGFFSIIIEKIIFRRNQDYTVGSLLLDIVFSIFGLIYTIALILSILDKYKINVLNIVIFKAKK